MTLSPKERVLNVLLEGKADRVPCFSGMGNVTTEGLKKHGIRFSEAHQKAELMARAASSTHELYGYESAVVPFDIGIEAEALGCELNFYERAEGILYPTVKTKVLGMDEAFEVPGDLLERGRIPVVAEALRLLKKSVGEKIAVGSYILGPFTLAGQLMDLSELLKNSFKRQQDVKAILETLTAPLIALGRHLRKEGADFITIREMGAPSDIISPKMFGELILPPLMRVIQGLPEPRILHMCGNTNPIVEMMHQSGAEAISVEQKNDIAATRAKLGEDAIIFGNIDPINVLVKGTPAEVRRAVQKAINAGVNGVMPGCDIWPEARPENMRAMVEATIEFGGN